MKNSVFMALLISIILVVGTAAKAEEAGSPVEQYRQERLGKRGEDESLEIFLTLLRLMKHGDPDGLITVAVAQKLENHADRPEYVKIARAMCMAEDGYIPEALALLDEMDRELSEAKTHREYKHIPLYQASILFKEGRDYPAAEAAFLEFIARNEGKSINQERLIQE